MAQSNFISRHSEMMSLEILFTFIEGKRKELHLFSQSSMKPTIIMDNILQHPTGSRAAHDEHDVPLFTSPIVPKISKFANKFSRLRACHPWQFIQEDDFSFASLLANHLSKQPECLSPISRLRTIKGETIIQKAVIKLRRIQTFQSCIFVAIYLSHFVVQLL